MVGDLRALSSAHDLGNWVRKELASERPDAKHALRVIARETDRWFTHGLSPHDIAGLASEPARTGDVRWDALIEGVVAYRLHLAGMAAPPWCLTTRLDEGWDPYDTPSIGWRLLDMFETPAELLHKGVTLSHRSMELL
ncbi:MAG: hypothetical protein WCP28_21360 [Actinomycetes bacterium]